MSFSIGIVGLPNIGKSTLFQAITKKQVDISNYPFCTIDPNVGCIAVPDERLDKLAKLIKLEKVIPTAIEFVDIAGLISGAHTGEGLGNQFLSYIRETNAILHVVRLFEDKEVVYAQKKTSPLHDIDIVNTELILADLETTEKHLKKIENDVKSHDKEAIQKNKILLKIKNNLEKNKAVRDIKLTEKEKELTKDLSFLTIKPVLYLANISEDQLQNKPLLPNVSPIIAVPLKLELELEELSPEERKEYLSQLGLEESGLETLIKESYRLLDLITFFTLVGGKEIRAWTLKKDSTVLEAAGKVHTDFQEKFIKAEVVSYEDFIKAGSEAKAREMGLVNLCGKEYVVEDGDVVKFKI
jgi:hypothetical protein